MRIETVNNAINKLFDEAKQEIPNIFSYSGSAADATKNISNYMAHKLSTASRSCISTIYSELSKSAMRDPIFESAENLDKFYSLRLQNKMYNKFKLDIDDLSSYRSEIDYKEINRIYASAGAAVGTLALGCAVKAAASGMFNVPLLAVIAGAALVGGGAYFKVVPDHNKKAYFESADKFLDELKKEVVDWVGEIENYFDREIAEFKIQCVENGGVSEQ